MGKTEEELAAMRRSLRSMISKRMGEALHEDVQSAITCGVAHTPLGPLTIDTLRNVAQRLPPMSKPTGCRLSDTNMMLGLYFDESAIPSGSIYMEFMKNRSNRDKAVFKITPYPGADLRGPRNRSTRRWRGKRMVVHTYWYPGAI